MARNIRVEETSNYDKFITLKGNRNVDRNHVKVLQKKMVEEGNLTEIIPIIVNEKMEVIDGQHRLEALRELEWPVFYEVKKGLTLDTVTAINNGNKNWSWFDKAFSYAELGNENYQRFLNLWDYFSLSYSILVHYAGVGDTGRKASGFSRGKFVMGDQEKAFKLLKQYKEIAEAADHANAKFAHALYDVMVLPDYDHKRMLDKMSKYAGDLKIQSKKVDYLRDIEDVYNTYVTEVNKVRLF